MSSDTLEDVIYRDDDELADSLATAEEDPTDVPLGSRLGEDRARSARIRSARLMSARKSPERMPADGGG